MCHLTNLPPIIQESRRWESEYEIESDENDEDTFKDKNASKICYIETADAYTLQIERNCLLKGANKNVQIKTISKHATSHLPFSSCHFMNITLPYFMCKLFAKVY